MKEVSNKSSPLPDFMGYIFYMCEIYTLTWLTYDTKGGTGCHLANWRAADSSQLCQETATLRLYVSWRSSEESIDLQFTKLPPAPPTTPK